ANTLACISRQKSGGTVTSYLAAMPPPDADPERAVRQQRNAVSVMVSVGAPAVEPLCESLADERDEGGRVAARALAVMAWAESVACLTRTLAGGAPPAREAAGAVIRLMLSGRPLGVAEGFALVQRVLGDPDPAMRALGLQALVMFNGDAAQ